ncbi:DUF3473 domain-containing protein [Ectobacillus sp. JY-23]|uniref:DUF3473 domain-containing protein n=1 Tax=Ectobacillus sp. JY-23 TaxID=2933872 RepID=UPI0034A06370
MRNQFYEFMLPFRRIGPYTIPLGGGGYFRLYPYFIYKRMLCHISQTPFVFYIHPYELDVSQPHYWRTNVMENVRMYYGVRSTYQK